MSYCGKKSFEEKEAEVEEERKVQEARMRWLAEERKRDQEIERRRSSELSIAASTASVVSDQISASGYGHAEDDTPPVAVLNEEEEEEGEGETESDDDNDDDERVGGGEQTGHYSNSNSNSNLISNDSNPQRQAQAQAQAQALGLLADYVPSQLFSMNPDMNLDIDDLMLNQAIFESLVSQDQEQALPQAPHNSSPSAALEESQLGQHTQTQTQMQVEMETGNGLDRIEEGRSSLSLRESMQHSESESNTLAETSGLGTEEEWAMVESRAMAQLRRVQEESALRIQKAYRGMRCRRERQANTPLVDEKEKELGKGEVRFEAETSLPLSVKASHTATATASSTSRRSIHEHRAAVRIQRAYRRSLLTRCRRSGGSGQADPDDQVMMRLLSVMSLSEDGAE